MPCHDTTTLANTGMMLLDGSPLKLGPMARAALAKLPVQIGQGPELEGRLEASCKVVADAVDRGEPIYGVTTGFGGMADKAIPCGMAADLQNNLLAFLSTGAGDSLENRHVRAAMLLRANVLLQGYSGVRKELIQRLIKFVQANATPRVRTLGSIGASGDLVPLAAIARAITGHELAGESAIVEYAGESRDSRYVLGQLGLDPIELLPKEGLALVNGTSCSAAIAANATFETQSLLAMTMGIQSMMLRVLVAHEEPFQPFVHERKPHPGQIWSAKVTRELLLAGRPTLTTQNGTAKPIQDRYSLRCLPQYMGPIVESLARIQRTIETEMNAVSDNPLVDANTGTFYQSGNFLGQYIANAMDELRQNIGMMAKHLDVQIATMVTPEFSGLPASLRGNEAKPYNMGLKGLQVTGNSIMPLLTYYANGLTAHYPTHAEQFNQNINGLSFGAANLAWESVGLYQRYLAITLLFVVQGLDLRAKSLVGHYDGRVLLGEVAESIYSAIFSVLDVGPSESRPLLFDDADRWLELDVEKLAANIRCRGTLLTATQPILDSFHAAFGGVDPT